MSPPRGPLFNLARLRDPYDKLLTEYLGTMFLALAVSLSVSSGLGDFAAMSGGFVFLTQVFAFGYLSGGFMSPGIVATVYLVGAMPRKQFLQYAAAQTIGAFTAALLSSFLIWDNDKYWAPMPQNDSAVAVIRAFVVEALFTCGFYSVSLHVGVSVQKDNTFYGIVVGLFVTGCVWASSRISGGMLNPAIGFSLHVVRCATHSCDGIRHIWIYVLAPFVGSVCAAITFQLTSASADVEEHNVGIQAENMTVIQQAPVAQDGKQLPQDGKQLVVARSGTPGLADFAGLSGPDKQHLLDALSALETASVTSLSTALGPARTSDPPSPMDDDLPSQSSANAAPPPPPHLGITNVVVQTSGNARPKMSWMTPNVGSLPAGENHPLAAQPGSNGASPHWTAPAIQIPVEDMQLPPSDSAQPSAPAAGIAALAPAQVATLMVHTVAGQQPKMSWMSPVPAPGQEQ